MRSTLVVILSLAVWGCRATDSSSQAEGSTDTDGDDEADATDETDDGPVTEDLPSPWHCNPVSEPCPEGEKCTIVREPTVDSKCVPIHEDPVAIGEACELLEGGLDNCPDHAACLGGECVGVCDEESTLGCPEGQLCGWNNNTNYTAYCHQPCHPLEPTDCEADERCVPGNAIGFECGPLGAQHSEGEPCPWPGDCAAGLVCVYFSDNDPRCKPYCSLIDGGCTDPDVCLSWYEDGVAPPGYEDVGVCFPP